MSLWSEFILGIRVLGRTGLLYTWWLVENLRRGGLERLLCFHAMQQWFRTVMLCVVQRKSLCFALCSAARYALRYAAALAMLSPIQRCLLGFALCSGARNDLRFSGARNVLYM